MENITRDVHLYRLTQRPSAPPDPPKPKLSRATRIVVGVVTLLVVGLLLLHLIPLPFARTLTALEIKPDDLTYAVERTIRLSGKYQINLFRGDSFTGHIAADGFPASASLWELEQTVFLEPLVYTGRGSHCSLLRYVTPEDEAAATNGRSPQPTGDFADVYAKPFFRGVIIGVLPSYGDYSSLLVVGAETREEAMEILQSRLSFEYEY